MTSIQHQKSLSAISETEPKARLIISKLFPSYSMMIKLIIYHNAQYMPIDLAVFILQQTYLVLCLNIVFSIYEIQNNGHLNLKLCFLTHSTGLEKTCSLPIPTNARLSISCPQQTAMFQSTYR